MLLGLVKKIFLSLVILGLSEGISLPVRATHFSNLELRHYEDFLIGTNVFEVAEVRYGERAGVSDTVGSRFEENLQRFDNRVRTVVEEMTNGCMEFIDFREQLQCQRDVVSFLQVLQELLDFRLFFGNSVGFQDNLINFSEEFTENLQHFDNRVRTVVEEMTNGCMEFIDFREQLQCQRDVVSFLQVLQELLDFRLFFGNSVGFQDNLINFGEEFTL